MSVELSGSTDIHEFLERNAQKTLLRFSTGGSVDDGKSTLIGRLLHDCKSIYEDQLSALKDASATVGTGPAIDFALLTDGLKAEREQGITIDVAYRYFSTPKRNFIIADTPGHEQYTRNMATGASTANLAVILIDARHGILTQTKRHSFIASLLRIPRLLICVNKMDLVDWSEEVFERIRKEYTEFAARLEIVDLKFIPISALCGDNVVDPSPNMEWYRGESVLGYLENVYTGSDRNLIDFRLPVQYVMRPNLDFRGFCGQIASGKISVGDEITALPSMKTSRVKSIVSFDSDLEYAFAPMSVTLTLEDEIDISRGDMIVHSRNLPHLQSDFEAMVIWMSEEAMDPSRPYTIKHTTKTTRATIESLRYRVDVNTLHRSDADCLELNDIGRVAFSARQDLFVDPYKKNKWTGSFVLIDTVSNSTVAAGMVIDRIPAEKLRERKLQSSSSTKSENIRRETGNVTVENRESALGQRGITIWFTGLSGSGKSSVSQLVEQRLHDEGRHVYSLDGDNVRFGLNRDLGFTKDDRTENIRRVAEVSRLFNDAGIITLVPVISPFREDRENARAIVGEDRFFEIHVDTPLEVCEQRDVKGLYEKARAGEIEEFTGVSSPYEPPQNPALTIGTVDLSARDCAEEVFEAIKGLLRAR